MEHFFEKYPDILCEVKHVLLGINFEFNSFKINESEYDFDVLLPFLIDNIPIESARVFSKELKLHREIVNQYNLGNKDTDNLVLQLKKITNIEIKNFSDYSAINSKYRTLEKQDILISYFQSTERVYYRFNLIKSFPVTNEQKEQLLYQIRIFSAFLLFDDDVCDLEKDIINKKDTILIQYLKNNYNMESAISLFINSLNEIKEPLLKDFANQFKKIYQSYE